MLHRFAIADLPTMPWKNGGGRTREVVCWPPGADMAACDWRVSIASITRSGPFSVFAGMDRHILLLAGDGVLLDAPGHWRHALDTPLQPFAFAGDAAVDCTLRGGESTDFNVMTRRGAVQADVQVLCHSAPLRETTGGVLLAVHGGWTLETGATRLDVQAGEGVWWADAAHDWGCTPHCARARLVAVRLTSMGE